MLAGARFAAVVSALLVVSASVDARSLRDATGRDVEVNDASRIVSIGGAVTEILYTLGIDKKIVAVDTTSTYPRQALVEKPNVGYMRQLSPEGVLGLAPSLILANEGAGPQEAVAVLQAAKVPFVMVPDHFTGEGIIEKIQTVAAAVDASVEGDCLVDRVRADLDALALARSRIGRPLKVLFLLSFMNGRPMVAGRATAADGIIRLAGGVNAIDDYEGYKLLNDEGIIAAQPDAVLVMRRDSLHLDAKTVFSHPSMAPTPAAQHGRLVVMDGLYLLGFGPRTAAAARDLARSLYPDLAAGTLPSENETDGRRGCR